MRKIFYILNFLFGAALISIVCINSQFPVYDFLSGLIICSVLVVILNIQFIIAYLDQSRVWTKNERDIANYKVLTLMDITSDYETGLTTREDVLRLFGRINRSYRLVVSDSNFFGWIWLRFEIAFIQKEIEDMFLKIEMIQECILTAKCDNPRYIIELKHMIARLSYLSKDMDESSEIRLNLSVAIMDYKKATKLSEEFSNRNLEVHRLLVSANKHAYKAISLCNNQIHEGILVYQDSNQ